MTTVYSITGMHCANCAAKIQAALAHAADRVEVSLDPPEVRLTGPETSGLDALNSAIAKAGAYRLTPKVDAIALEETATWLITYRPLLIIAGFIAIASLAGTMTASGINGPLWMTHLGYM